MLDVIIVGAGVAGLACAQALRKSGARVRVFEARDRAGGRVWSLHEDGLPVAVELGAEFLHGRAAEAERVAHEHAMLVVDVEGAHKRIVDGRMVDGGDEIWSEQARVMDRIDAGAPDESFASFLAKESDVEAREAARNFVEGFQAARADEISTQSLAGGPELGTGRMLHGYDGVVAALQRDVDLVLRARVDSIHVEHGVVEVKGPHVRQRAKIVVVAVPLGVLQSKAIAIEPMPNAVEAALSAMGVARATRVSLLLSERAWDDDVSFIHSGDDAFPTWWTAYPARVPLLTMWAGGPKSDALAGLDDKSRIERALKSLEDQLGVSSVLRAWSHDWQRDPFTRGAYSYRKVHGVEASAHFAEDFAPLFFAGEHTMPADRAGTVDGAIASGLRVAEQIAATLGTARAEHARATNRVFGA